jgi:hypothetical protein
MMSITTFEKAVLVNSGIEYENGHSPLYTDLRNERPAGLRYCIRLLRQEMCERKCALDVVSSNSPDVARQQQWILGRPFQAKSRSLRIKYQYCPSRATDVRQPA